MKRPKPQWDTSKLRLLDEHADRNRQPNRTRNPGRHGPRAHATRGVPGHSPQPATTAGRPPSGAAASPHRSVPRYVRWLEQRHGRWARLGLAVLVAIVAAGLIAAAHHNPAQMELGLAGALLGTGVGVGTYGTNMWQQLTPTHPAYQWTATGVLTLGEVIFWGAIVALIAMAAMIVISVMLIVAALWLVAAMFSD